MIANAIWKKSAPLHSLIVALVILQTLPGCSVFSTADNAGRARYASVSHRVNYGQTADYSAFARQTEDELSTPGDEQDNVLPVSYSEITPGQMRSVTLLHVIRQALNNNEVVPVDVQFLSGSSPLLNAPQAVPSIYDPLIQATAVSGDRGSVAASSDFVPQFQARSTWGQDEVIQNNFSSAGLPGGSVLDSETGNLELVLQQRLLSGGNLELSHITNFDNNNSPANLFPNVYQGTLAVDFTQPLWGGAGNLFTEIAGPIDLISTRAPTVDQGIVVTRINEQLSHNEFQVALRQLVKDATDVYADLYLVHQRYRIEVEARDATEKIWHRQRAKADSGVGDALAATAQAEENFYAAEARVKDVRAEIALVENRLRRLMGLPPGDGLVLEPVEPPGDHAYLNDSWEQSLETAFAQRPEINETVLTIQSLELQRSAAMSLSNPRLDLVSNFHVNGFGDRPFNESKRGTIRRDSYYQNLLRAERTGWFAGVQFSVPLDRRLTRSLEHQLEYRLAKARAALKAQKKEISHELWHAFRNSERWSNQIQENDRRVKAARQQVSALEAAYGTGRVTVDIQVRAQTTLAQAESEYARAVTEYNKAIAEIRFRRGTLLEDLHIGMREPTEPPTLTLPPST